MKNIVNQLHKEFLELFENQWAAVLAEYQLNHKQLLIGSRLRPQIVLWGYLAGADWTSSMNFNNVSAAAISIELIHKASLLLDDWIDGDSARHGENAFHIDYGEHEAVMTAMLMVTISLNRLTILKIEDAESLDCIGLIIKTAEAMTQGVIKELHLNKETIFNYELIKEIAALETSEILGNSLLLGFLLSDKKNNNLKIILKKIGDLSGFLFQTLNDLESFSSSFRNQQHKGNVNYDFNKYRKNIVAAKLYTILTSEEKSILESTNDIQIFKEIYNKYKMKKIILREIEIVFKEILNLIASTSKYGASQQWINGYTAFMHYLKETASKRLD